MPFNFYDTQKLLNDLIDKQDSPFIYEKIDLYREICKYFK